MPHSPRKICVFARVWSEVCPFSPLQGESNGPLIKTEVEGLDVLTSNSCRLHSSVADEMP